MTIHKGNLNRRIVIDTRGPDGNAFVLISYAISMAKQLGFDKDQIVKEMKSSDYNNLIKVFDKYFGEYVDIIVKEDEEDEDE